MLTLGESANIDIDSIKSDIPIIAKGDVAINEIQQSIISFSVDYHSDAAFRRQVSQDGLMLKQ